MNRCACTFFGHRDIKVTNELKEELTRQIIDLIEYKSVEIFYFGGFSNFDDLCWQVVTEQKIKYQYIKRIYCLSDPRHQRLSKRPKWLKDGDFEEFIYLDLKFDYWYSRIYYRNCAMIDRSDYIIFYVIDTENSGAYKAMQYAKRKKKKYINLGCVNIESTTKKEL